MSVLLPDDLRFSSEASEEMIAAAELLRDATLEVRDSQDSAAFEMDVGIDGRIGGTLTMRPERIGERIKLHVGYSNRRSVTSPDLVRPVFGALDQFAEDLVTVYFESGHTLIESGVWTRDMNVPPFQNWDFVDFAGYDIMREKPNNRSPKEVHDTPSRWMETILCLPG